MLTVTAAVGMAVLAAGLAGSVPAWAQETFRCQTTEGRAQSRIVGGQQARIDEWPWQVLVQGTTPDGETLTCGGSIIAPRWILTAAHCLVDGDGISFADYGLEYSVVYGEDRPLSHLGIEADRLIPHEGFDPETLDHDIALIRLTANIPDSRPVQLSSERLDQVFARPGVCATVTGWGKISEEGGGSELLRRADLPIKATRSCDEAYPGQVTERNVCAGYDEGGVDSCQGDSGGPLVVRHGDSGRYVQVGVVSWGIGCARPGNPGIYTRVSQYIGWIQSHTGR
ncbi:MAG: serine protease [Alphaproteobacteria bacterium]|nr:serine protease [Alphaproteobacteria bacterium]